MKGFIAGVVVTIALILGLLGVRGLLADNSLDSAEAIEGAVQHRIGEGLARRVACFTETDPYWHCQVTTSREDRGGTYRVTIDVDRACLTARITDGADAAAIFIPHDPALPDAVRACA